jgi:hypothetical protein
MIDDSNPSRKTENAAYRTLVPPARPVLEWEGMATNKTYSAIPFPDLINPTEAQKRRMGTWTPRALQRDDVEGDFPTRTQLVTEATCTLGPTTRNGSP